MTASELIVELSNLIKKYGNLPVHIKSFETDLPAYVVKCEELFVEQNKIGKAFLIK
jgi:hypothetical protein